MYTCNCSYSLNGVCFVCLCVGARIKYKYYKINYKRLNKGNNNV